MLSAVRLDCDHIFSSEDINRTFRQIYILKKHPYALERQCGSVPTREGGFVNSVLILNAKVFVRATLRL